MYYNYHYISIDKYSRKLLAELETVEGIAMTIKEYSLTNTSGSIIIINDTEEVYLTVQKFRIDKYVNENRYKISMEKYIVTTMGALQIINGEFLEIDLNWEKYYGKLEPGKYRIVKDLKTYDNSKNYNVGVEFSIE